MKNLATLLVITFGLLQVAASCFGEKEKEMESPPQASSDSLDADMSEPSEPTGDSFGESEITEEGATEDSPVETDEPPLELEDDTSDNGMNDESPNEGEPPAEIEDDGSY